MDSSSNTNINENNQREGGKKRGGSQKRSWVWEWFTSDGIATATCQVECSNGELCNKRYQHGSSTGVLIDHLLKAHQITKGMTKQDYVVRNKLYLNIFFNFTINNLIFW